MNPPVLDMWIPISMTNICWAVLGKDPTWGPPRTNTGLRIDNHDVIQASDWLPVESRILYTSRITVEWTYPSAVGYRRFTASPVGLHQARTLRVGLLSQRLQFPPTVQKHTHHVDWSLSTVPRNVCVCPVMDRWHVLSVFLPHNQWLQGYSPASPLTVIDLLGMFHLKGKSLIG